MTGWLVVSFTAYQPFSSHFNAELSHFDKSFKQYTSV